MTPTFQSVAPDLTKGGAWMLAMRVFIRTLGLVNVVILARLLAPSDFGIVAMATLAVGLLQLFADVSVDLLLLRRDSVSEQQMNTAWTLQVIAGIVITCISLLLAPALVAYYAEPRVAVALFIVALQPGIAGFENIGVVDFRRKLQFQREFWYWVVRHLIRFAFALTLAIALRSYVALAIAVPMSATITVGVSFWMSSFRPRFELRGIVDLWRSARWLVALNVSQYLTYRADEFIVGGFAGSNNMGAYYVASDVATIANRELVGAIGRAIYPTISLIKDNAAQTRDAFVRIFALHVAACLAIGCGLALVAPSLVPVLLGDKWLAGIPVFQWIAVCSVFEGLILATLPFFITAGHERFVGLFHAGHATALVAALLVARQAGDFILIAQTRSFIAAAALAVCLARARTLGHVLWLDVFKASWRPMVSAAVMSLAVLAMARADLASGLLGLALQIGVGALIFVLSQFGLWILAGRPQGAERDVMQTFGHWRVAAATSK